MGDVGFKKNGNPFLFLLSWCTEKQSLTVSKERGQEPQQASGYMPGQAEVRDQHCGPRWTQPEMEGAGYIQALASFGVQSLSIPFITL